LKRGKHVTITEGRCKPCLVEYNHKRQTTDEFREYNRNAKKKPEYKVWRKKYRQRDEVIEQEEKYRVSLAGRASTKRRKNKYYGSEKWRAFQDKENQRRRKVYAENELVRINVSLSNVVGRMVRGIRFTSRSLYSYTEFEDANDLMQHLDQQLTGDMTVENYGEVWHIEHRVAKCWYENTEEDIRRCWSKANIAPCLGPENLAKSIKIIDEYCNQAGPENWPVAWNGVLPGKRERAEMYRKMLVR
tara:strand:+ start:5268 stop:6002 length:735 start_codon:yes stop_codon:yes gene_type:complete